jgi:succinate dehydrogenase/fumarate reductase flavoprotein subunit
MEKHTIAIDGKQIPVYVLNTVVIGSGAASLSCADHLNNLGQSDLAIVTDKLGAGTSYNAGSDKQTYYKISLFGKEKDAAYDLAKTLYDGGSMHGDLALIEATLSAQCFFRLVQIGVPFPHTIYGGFVGYKTDHDPKQRATSAGPWTSQQMCQSLLKAVKKNRIKIFDKFEVVSLIRCNDRISGLIALDKKNLHASNYGLTIFQTENCVFGVGGPGGIYKMSVYPEGHSGAIGLALEIGAKAVNLTESQYGLASTKFRWNLSGSYQQVIPRYISTDLDGSHPRQFLNASFPSMGKLASAIFLKGYQWPFDPGKIEKWGSSLIDLLVFHETAVNKKRVFLDFQNNPSSGDGLHDFSFKDLDKEAYGYLEKSQALFGKPIDRLQKMNPMAIELFKQNGIDLTKELLEIDVCAQHNNGGLAGDIWWESNIKHLFPIGEVNGTHGVYRPGGASLNAGQVGALRAAQRIAHVYQESTLPYNTFITTAKKKCGEMIKRIEYSIQGGKNKINLHDYTNAFQNRMHTYGAHIRDRRKIAGAVNAAYQQLNDYLHIKTETIEAIPAVLRTHHLVLTHIAYLEAIQAYLLAGGGSRGSYLVIDPEGIPLLEDKLPEWKYKPEDIAFHDTILETNWNGKKYTNRFIARRTIPEEEAWFETVWQDYSKNKIFKPISEV